MNISKKRDPRFWKRWYQSGAVPQAELFGQDLVISAVGTFHFGVTSGFSTLSMGKRIVNSGLDWSVSKPVCVVVVSTKDDYKFGMKLERLPGDAVPADLFLL